MPPPAWQGVISITYHLQTTISVSTCKSSSVTHQMQGKGKGWDGRHSTLLYLRILWTRLAWRAGHLMANQNNSCISVPSKMCAPKTIKDENRWTGIVDIKVLLHVCFGWGLASALSIDIFAHTLYNITGFTYGSLLCKVDNPNPCSTTGPSKVCDVYVYALMIGVLAPCCAILTAPPP